MKEIGLQLKSVCRVSGSLFGLMHGLRERWVHLGLDVTLIETKDSEISGGHDSTNDFNPGGTPHRRAKRPRRCLPSAIVLFVVLFFGEGVKGGWSRL